MQSLLINQSNLFIEQASVEDLIVKNGRCCGVTDSVGKNWLSGAVVLTTGTFLKGVIHQGDKNIRLVG